MTAGRSGTIVQHSASTVVCLVGSVPERVRRVLGAHTTYVVHDDDPLAPVADAWVRLFEDHGAIGELEVRVAETVARWRARTLELPDYYLVTGVAELSDTRRHWYFGALHAAAPHRVVPVDPEAARVLGTLEALAPGRWWPPLDQLLEGIEHVAPDVVGTPTDNQVTVAAAGGAAGILGSAP